MPPGVVGQWQLGRGGPLAGYVQPVRLVAPPGALICLPAPDGFSPPQPGPLSAGLLVGAVYRLKVLNIPGREGQAVYPTIELIDRLYPPPGQAAQFPIPIVFDQDDLQLALDGRLVTRVVYLEDPQTALPAAEQPDTQRYFDVGPRQDPLAAADLLGRPLAIVRMGSRTPDTWADPRFLYGPAPVTSGPGGRPLEEAAP